MTVHTSKKVLSFSDIVIMTVVANFGIRWLAIAAGIGPSSIVYWLLGALIFFLPLSIVTSQLSKLYPEQGGVYAWARHVLGEKPAFMVAWTYWVTNFFYYPAILIFLATNFAYFLGRPDLANNHIYITCAVLVAFWLTILISMFGLKTSTYVVKIGGILGTFFPVIALLCFGLLFLVIFKHSATNFDLHQFIPNQHIFNSLSTLTMIMFAMAGLEIIPTFANSVRNPKRDLFFGLIVGATIIFLLYTFGTIAMNVIESPDKINNASGLIHSFSIVGNTFHFSWMTKLFAFLLTFAELAAVTIWLLAPITMLFKCTQRGIFPNWFYKTNQYQSPNHALLFMGILVSIIILLTNIIPSISDMYQVLVLMSTILYFIPYLFLAVIFIKTRHKIQLNNKLVSSISVLIFFSVCLGIVFSFPPPANLVKLHDIIAYEAELIFGPTLFLAIGWILYSVRIKKLQNQPSLTERTIDN